MEFRLNTPYPHYSRTIRWAPGAWSERPIPTIQVDRHQVESTSTPNLSPWWRQRSHPAGLYLHGCWRYTVPMGHPVGRYAPIRTGWHQLDFSVGPLRLAVARPSKQFDGAIKSRPFSSRLVQLILMNTSISRWCAICAGVVCFACRTGAGIQGWGGQRRSTDQRVRSAKKARSKAGARVCQAPEAFGRPAKPTLKVLQREV